MARTRKTIRKHYDNYFDSGNGKKTPYLSIDHQPVSESNRVGYCHLNKHPGYLTERLIKEHGCLGKQCPYLHKYEDNKYWQRREEKKKLKKEKKLLEA